MTDSLVKYTRLKSQEKELKEEIKGLKNRIITKYGEGKSTTEIGTVNIFSKKIKGFSLIAFRESLDKYGVEHMYNIVNVIQSRLSVEEKENLEVLGTQNLEIRVTLK